MKDNVRAPLESAKKFTATFPVPFFADPPPPDRASLVWGRWRGSKRLALWQAVALACNIDPDRLSSSIAALCAYSPPFGPMKPEQAIDLLRHDGFTDLVRLPRQWLDFKARLALAERCLEELGCRRGPEDYVYIRDFELRVSMARFAAWATSDDIAWKLPRGFPWTRRAARPPFALEKWNANFRHAGAALRALYGVKTARKKAPTQETVTQWLMKNRGLSSGEANRIAAFIQPDGVARP